MNEKSKNTCRLLLTATLIISTAILSLEACRERVELVPTGGARVVQRLENGNYEVTPEFLVWTGRLRQEIERLKKKLGEE